MEFRNRQHHHHHHDELGSQPPSFFTPSNAPQHLRGPAFSKPTLSTSPSLLFPRPTPTQPTSIKNGEVFATTTTTDHSAAAVSSTTKASLTTHNDVCDHIELNYKECLRNHAASIGGHVVDGCGEFMRVPTDPLKCAACGCHRSFHRKEFDTSAASGHRPAPLMLPPPQLASGGTTTESSSEEMLNAVAVAEQPRKRFRTKFSAEQKAKMLEFAEKIGWRIQRQDEAMLDEFCGENGVRRQVLKVWMHNNKQTAKKQQEAQEVVAQHEMQASALQQPLL